jgi:hypothetical protein
MYSSLLEPKYLVSSLTDSKTVKANAIFTPQMYLSNTSGSPLPTDVVIDGASWTSVLNRLKQLELQNSRITNMELKLTSLIQSVRTILIYLNDLKVAVELLDSAGEPVNPPPIPPL